MINNTQLNTSINFDKSIFIKLDDSTYLEQSHSEIFSKIFSINLLDKLKKNEEVLIPQTDINADVIQEELLNINTVSNLVSFIKHPASISVVYKFDKLNFTLNTRGTDRINGNEDNETKLNKTVSNYQQILHYAIGNDTYSDTRLNNTTAIGGIILRNGSGRTSYDKFHDVINSLTADCTLPEFRYESNSGIYVIMKLEQRNNNYRLDTENTGFTLTKEVAYRYNNYRLHFPHMELVDYKDELLNVFRVSQRSPHLNYSKVNNGDTNISTGKTFPLPNIYNNNVPYTCFGSNRNVTEDYSTETSGRSQFERFINGRFNRDINNFSITDYQLRHFIRTAKFNFADKVRLGEINVTETYQQKLNEVLDYLLEVFEEVANQVPQEDLEIISMNDEVNTNLSNTLEGTNNKYRQLASLNLTNISVSSFFMLLISTLSFTPLDSLYESDIKDKIDEIIFND